MWTKFAVLLALNLEGMDKKKLKYELSLANLSITAHTHSLLSPY